MPVPPFDERPRFYRAKTSKNVTVIVGFGGPDDPVDVRIERPLDAMLGIAATANARLSPEEAWTLWGCLHDGLVASYEPPGWTAIGIPATDADGVPLPPFPTGSP